MLVCESYLTIIVFQSYEKQGFHSGTPPPFNLAGNQSTGMAPNAAYGATQMYIPTMPHQQHHSTTLMHQPLHQVRHSTNSYHDICDTSPSIQSFNQYDNQGLSNSWFWLVVVRLFAILPCLDAPFSPLQIFACFNS